MIELSKSKSNVVWLGDIKKKVEEFVLKEIVGDNSLITKQFIKVEVGEIIRLMINFVLEKHKDDFLEYIKQKGGD